MRFSFSALLLSTALATGFGAGALTVFVPVAQAQDAVQAGEVDVDALLALLPGDAKATYGDKSYDSLTGITTVRDLKIFDPGAETQNFIAIQEVGLRGVDMDAFKHVFDFAAYGATPDETFKQLFGDVLIKSASLTVNGQLIGGMEELALGGVQMKQLAAKPPGFDGGDRDQEAAARFFGALLDGAIAGAIKVTDLTVEAQGNRTSIKSLAFEGVNRGQVGASSLDTFEASASGLTTKIASATSEGADLTKVIPWLLQGEMPPVEPEGLLYFGASTVNGLSYEMQGTTVSIASYTIDPVSFYWLVPSSLKLSINDIVYKPGANDPSGGQEGLAELGLDHLDLDINFEWAFDGAGGGASLKELRIAESQLFDMALSFDLTGINLAQLVDSQTAQGAMMAVGMTGAQFFLKNNGGFDKVLAAVAREQGTTPDAIKQQALEQLSQIEGGMPQPDGSTQPLSDRLKSIVAAFKSFINSPGTLTIKVQPASPITVGTGMGAMFDPMSGADALGITVEATPQ